MYCTAHLVSVRSLRSNFSSCGRKRRSSLTFTTSLAPRSFVLAVALLLTRTTLASLVSRLSRATAFRSFLPHRQHCLVGQSARNLTATTQNRISHLSSTRTLSQPRRTLATMSPMEIDPSSSSPNSGIDIPKTVGDFKLVVEDSLEFAPEIQIAKWQSESTGLKVVWASNESPLVQGYASIVSEIFDGAFYGAVLPPHPADRL